MANKGLLLLLLSAGVGTAQSWPQWGRSASHTGSVAVAGQRPEVILGQFLYDTLADQMRKDSGGALLVHYMAPLVDGDDVFILSRGDSQWVSCRTNEAPCGPQLWKRMQWGITKLHSQGGKLEPKWTATTTWTPPPDSGTRWEPVFHPALSGNYVYLPAENGMIMKVSRLTGDLVDCFEPYEDLDPNRYITSPVTVDAQGALYYTVMTLVADAPWSRDVRQADLVKVDPDGATHRRSFPSLVPEAPAHDCSTTFSGQALPWPPSPSAVPPAAECGSQRPGLNAAPAVAADGTVYVVSRAHFNSAYSYLVAVNPDLTPKWAASLRDRLNDGCDVLLPSSGTLGGCRAGSNRGVDPATNQRPAGRVADQSTASPVIAPDGSVYYGAYTRYNYSRGHLLHFSVAGEYLDAYDFGWDITPAIDEHDGAWSVIVKDNFYDTGSYCDVIGFCGIGAARYSITRLSPNLQLETSYTNTNDQSCERQADGSLACVYSPQPFEWCVNMVAVDRDGVVYANSEDGNLYAIDRAGSLVGSVFLKVAIGAAYTPLAIGGDGIVYTQNDGTLFAIGRTSPPAIQ